MLKLLTLILAINLTIFLLAIFYKSIFKFKISMLLFGTSILIYLVSYFLSYIVGPNGCDGPLILLFGFSHYILILCIIHLVITLLIYLYGTFKSNHLKV